MTREEVQGLMAMIQGTYPNFKPADKTAAVNAWSMALEDYDKNQVAAAFKVYMKSDTSGFAPVPGQIVDKIYEMTVPPELNEMEAWALVSRAIRNSGYNSAEEFAKLPPLVQKAVGTSDQLKVWALDEDYSDGVVSSNFIKCYRTICAGEKEIRKMPEQVRLLIEQTYRGSYPAQMEQMRQETIGRTAVRAIEKKADNLMISENIAKRLEELKEELWNND